MVVDEKALKNKFLNKKVYVTLENEKNTQIGILVFEDNTFFLLDVNNHRYFTAMDPKLIIRITADETDPEVIGELFKDVLKNLPVGEKK